MIATSTKPTSSAARRLLFSEGKLLARDPLTLTFVLAFPILTMLIVGGSFGTQADDAFPVNPSHWYVASYVSVVIGATGLVMLPVHIASYREAGVLRRFAAAGFPQWSFAFAEIVLGLCAIVTSTATLLLVASLVYGVPTVNDPLEVGLGFILGSVAFVGLGITLGTVMPSARAAQAIGLLLFFPSFLLGVGGPPPAVMSNGLRSVADVLPLKLVTDAIRDPWLGIANGTGALLVVSVLAIAAAVVAVRRSGL